MSKFQLNLKNPHLKESHRTNDKSFTRTRKLSFLTVVNLILSKSAKSIQNRLNEHFGFISEEIPSASAFSQARANLSHSVFIELYKDLIGGYYNDYDYNKYKGHRLLSIDGTKLRLPDTEDVMKEFGAVPINTPKMNGEYAGSQVSVLFDVLNELTLDSIMSHSKASEHYLAREHLNSCQEGDLILFDRNYRGYELFAEITGKKLEFISRCPRNAFGIIEKFLADERIMDQVFDLYPSHHLTVKKNKGLIPESLKVRLVKVFLSTGEIEILATSLLDQEKYPTEDFKALYNKRWRIETFFDKLKNRLSLENFTGKTAESVKQDFYSTICISNVETVMTEDVDTTLDNRKVNKAVSFNLIKTHAFELLFADREDFDETMDKLEKLFLRNTIPIKKNRSNHRISSYRRSMSFHKYKKKFVF